MNYFTFNSQSTTDFGLYVSRKSIYTMPERDVTFVEVPGRDGDVLIDNGRYKNVNISYDIGLNSIGTQMPNIKQWLAQKGYLHLSDSYQTGYYRLANYSSQLDIEEIIKNFGTATVTFNCKPYMYKTSGDTATWYTGTAGDGYSVTITNPESYPSAPLFRIVGSGTCGITVNGVAISVNIPAADTRVDIDCELQSAFREMVLKNNNLTTTVFPLLQPGDNTIAFTGNTTSLRVTPRWRRL